MLIKSGKNKLEMSSWHELIESGGGWVDTGRAAHLLGDRRRLDVLRDQASADYLLFRLVWSETRSNLFDLIPDPGIETKGKLVKKAGKYSWHEPPAPVKPNEAAIPAGK
jgi:hypothetical protein